MTVSLLAPPYRTDAVGNNVLQTFPFTFRILDATHIGVYVNGVKKTLALDYTVSGVGADQGSVFFHIPPANQAAITMVRDVPNNQAVDYTDASTLPAEGHESVVDKLAMEVQMLQEQLNRTPKIAIENIVSTPPEFPTYSSGKHIGWSATEPNVLDNKDAPISSGVTLSNSTPVAVEPITGTPIPGVSGEVSRADHKHKLSIDPLSSLSYFNVKSYGAVGNGVVNDSASIQAAANAAVGGVLFFPAGVYLINNGIQLSPNTMVMGVGNGSVLRAGSNAMSLLYARTPSAPEGNYRFRDFALDNNGKTGNNGITLDGVNSGIRLGSIWIDSIVTMGTFNVGIYLHFTANTFISNVFTSGAVNGFYQDQCADTSYINCSAQNGTNAGFTILGGGGAFDEGIRLSNCATNSQVVGITMTGTDWIAITGCSFTTASGGAMWISNCSDVKVTGSEISGVTASQAGINCDANAQSLQIVGNFFALDGYGIVVRGNRNIISNNLFVSNSIVDIYVANPALRTVINGNHCDSDVPVSIIEQAGANFTIATGNSTQHGISITGGFSLAANNI